MQKIEDNTLSIRVHQALNTRAKLEHYISFKKQKCAYYQDITQFLNRTINHLKKEEKNKKGLSSLAGSSGKITELQNEAKCWRKQSIRPQKSNNNENNKEKRCRIADHVKQIVGNQGGQKLREIDRLKQRKEELMVRIKQQLQVNEPYSYEKIVKRIQREGKKYGKIETISYLQKQIKQKSNWIDSQKTQIDKKHKHEQLEQTISGNLLKMKEISARKIATNQQIHGQFPDFTVIQKRIEKMRRCVVVIQGKIREDEKYMEERELETQLELNAGEHQGESVCFSSRELNEIRQNIQKAMQEIRQPLQTVHAQEVQQQLQQLAQTLNQYQRVHPW